MSAAGGNPSTFRRAPSGTSSFSRLSADRISTIVQPAKHLNRRALRPHRTDRLGVRSSWAGHRHMPRPLDQTPPSRRTMCSPAAVMWALMANSERQLSECLSERDRDAEGYAPERVIAARSRSAFARASPPARGGLGGSSRGQQPKGGTTSWIS